MARLKPPRHLGHNPAVGWVVLFMLASTIVLTVCGIITYSGEEGRGLFAASVSYDTGAAFAPIHEALAWIMLAVIAVHISAALFHDFILRENLVLTIITGTREDTGTWEATTAGLNAAQGRSKARLAILLALVIICTVAMAFLPPLFIGTDEGPTGVLGPNGGIVSVPVDRAWSDECSACHGLFHPTLLPARSWSRLMADLSDHFGDDASLDDETTGRIAKYLTMYSAERSVSEASRKILASIGRGDSPLRITGTGYWKHKHSEIKQEVWKRRSVVDSSNCAACHPHASEGSFDDADISVPE